MENSLVITQSNIPANFEDLSKFVLIGREKLCAVRAEIRAIEKVGLAQAVREQKLKEAQAISEAVLDAEVRIGELMREVPKTTNNNPNGKNQYGGGQSDSGVVLTKTKSEVIREAGFTPKQVERFQTLANHPEVVARAKAEAKANDDIVSRSAVLNMIKKEKRKNDIQRQVEEIEQKTFDNPEGLFNVIVVDPPWAYGTKYSSEGRRVANPYPEMSQAELKAIELPMDTDCVLFLWTTHKFIWNAKELLDFWGFSYRCMLIWDKKQIGMGDLLRMQCEFCLVGIKGKPVFQDVHNLRDIIEEPRREHSRKPEKFYELVNSLCTGRKLDYFSREHREGWVSFGNDTDKFMA